MVDTTTTAQNRRRPPATGRKDQAPVELSAIVDDDERAYLARTFPTLSACEAAIEDSPDPAARLLARLAASAIEAEVATAVARIWAEGDTAPTFRRWRLPPHLATDLVVLAALLIVSLLGILGIAWVVEAIGA